MWQLANKNSIPLHDLPSIDQAEQEIKNRREIVNELEKQIQSIKMDKEALVRETHEIFKKANARVVQREKEAEKLVELARLKMNEVNDKIEKINHAEKAQSEVIRGLEIDRKRVDDKFKQIDSTLEEPRAAGEVLSKQSVQLDEKEKQLNKRSDNLGIVEEALDKKAEKLKRQEEDIANKISFLESQQQKLDNDRFAIEVKVLEAQEKHKEALVALNTVREKEHSILLLASEVDKQRQTFEEKKIELLNLHTRNQEVLKILSEKEKVVDSKINQLNDLKARLNNLK